MTFEYDPWKSEANERKHGIDFEEAKLLWNDPDLISMLLDFGGERRKAFIGRYGGGLWTAITTMRGDSIRIISVRRSTRKEMKLYVKANNV